MAPALVELVSLSAVPGDPGGTRRPDDDRLGQGTDDMIARPYLPGDSMRRIHWRASAHRGELMVRQEERESTPDATVVLDRGALRWGPDAVTGAGRDTDFETGVTACVSIAARLVRDGYAVAVVDTAGAVLAERIAGGDLGALEHFRTALAMLTATRGDHLGEAARGVAGAMTGPVVLITGRLEPQDVAAVTPVLRRASAGVLVTVAPTRDTVARATAAGWRVAVARDEASLRAGWADAVGGAHGR